MNGSYGNNSQRMPFYSPVTGFDCGFRTPSPPEGTPFISTDFFKARFPSPQNYRSPPPLVQYHPYHSTPNIFDSPRGSPGQWNRRNNRSFGGNSSGSYRSDKSFSGPYNNSSKNPNMYQRSPSSSDSNPGHSQDIRQYVHPSMLEDPWKELMEKIEQNSTS